MKKSFIMPLMAIVVGVIQTLSAAELANVSSLSTVVPGEWNSNFAACKSYAESKGVPMLVFWSAPGCAKCNQLKNACNTDTFANWRKAKGIVMAFSEGVGTVKNFARNSSGQYPYLRLYWPAGNVDLRFTGRSTTIPANGATLEAKLMNCVDAYLKNWKPGSSSSEVNPPSGDDDENPLVPVVGPEWKKARKIWGSITDADGNVAGRVLVSAAKVHARKGTAKVKLQIVNLLGKMKTIGYKDLTVNKTTKGYLSGSIGNGTVSIKGSTISGKVTYENQTYTISSQPTGGALKDGGYIFALESAPSECQGLPVLDGTKFLPMAQKFTSTSSRWTFPAKGTPRYDSKTAAFVMSTTENPSQLKLAYTSSSGYFKGQFIVYAVRGKTLKKYVATVGGYMVGTKCHGEATIRNVGSFPCAVTFDK